MDLLMIVLPVCATIVLLLLIVLIAIIIRLVLSVFEVYSAVAPPGGKLPLWVDVQKLCNMCVLSLSWNFFVSHDKYIARPSSKEPR